MDDLRSVGILGGVFNPPHLGHLAAARHALRELGLARVLLMPVHTPPHKPTGEDPGPDHRLRMCQLAVEGVEGVSACALEIERGGASYTVDTLDAMHASHPHAELTFIVGADTASTLERWREPARLLQLAGLAVAERSGSDREAVLGVIKRIPRPDPVSVQVRFLEMPLVDVSSSMVRERVAAGESVERLVGPGVAAYIAEHDLYRTPAGVGG